MPTTDGGKNSATADTDATIVKSSHGRLQGYSIGVGEQLQHQQRRDRNPGIP